MAKPVSVLICTACMALLMTNCSSTRTHDSCPLLEGTWKSSKKLSMAQTFPSSTTDTQKQFLEQIWGHLSVSYQDGILFSHAAPTQSITINGKKYPFVFDAYQEIYTVEGCTPNTITVSSKDSGGTKQTRTMHFVDDDTYWVTADEYLPSVKEYFKRVSDKQ